MLKLLPDVIETIGRYIALRRYGLEYRGKCPFCRSTGFVVNSLVWSCFGCGAHEGSGGTVMAFEAMALAAGLRASSRRVVIPRRKSPRWTQCVPPVGSMPDFRKEWLGITTGVEPEYGVDGQVIAYRARHSTVGPRRWIYIRYSDVDTGQWKCRRLSIYERVRLAHPEMDEIVAKRVEGLDKVTVPELAGESWCFGYKAKAVAFALRRLGWVKLRNHTERYYVPVDIVLDHN